MTLSGHRRAALAGTLLVLASCSSVVADDRAPPEGLREGVAESPGARVFRERCASCHGRSGEGVKGKYRRALVGDKSVAQLARYIEKEMPDETPEECVGEDARRVARYIHDAFYSPLARERNRPARVELTRLTVAQHRNAVADLIGGSGAVVKMGEERGLRGQYFNARDPGRDRVIDRRDARVRFDFGKLNPDPKKLGKDGFAARWEGSLLAPETGRYEIIVRTDHAARLWLNDPLAPLIDVWVKSGSDTEFRASTFLLGGRWYPLKLEFSSRKQGVRNKGPELDSRSAFISLEWKLPHRVATTIPRRCLSPQSSPETFVPRTAFPPDDRSVGYERGTSVSKAWNDATTAVAIETADRVIRRISRLAGVGSKDPERAGKLRAFCERFVEGAFRRPLTVAERRLYVDRQLSSTADENTAVKRVVLLTLKSPRFLYLGLGGDRSDPYEVASRLSFAICDSPPDGELLAAAASGELSTTEELRPHAERIVEGPRARAKLRRFLHAWLDVEQARDLRKDTDRFPRFDEAVASDLRTSLDLFLEDVIWSEGSDFRRLFLSTGLHLNGRLAGFYGFDLPQDAGFRRVPAEPWRRSGVLTHPYLLAHFAYADASSPIHRGVFLARGVLGRLLLPPPEAFTPFAAELHPDLTTRERVALQTSPDACRGCHSTINSLGFTLEGLDAVGRYRTEDNGRPIDSTGSFEQESGETLTFAGPPELAVFLAGSEAAHRAFVLGLFHHLVQQPVLAYGLDVPERLRRAFAADRFNVRKLVARIAVSGALGVRRPASSGRQDKESRVRKSRGETGTY